MLPLLALFLFLTASLSVVSSYEDVRKICRTAYGSESCSNCNNQHIDCAWCADPDFSSHYRCDSKSELKKTCKASKITTYRSESTVAASLNHPLGYFDKQQSRTIQLQPQGYAVSLRPSDPVTLQFKYLHLLSNISSLTIRASHVQESEISLTYAINCQGRSLQGEVCPEVKPNDIIDFNVTVTLHACTGVPAVASIGINGYSGVAGLWMKQPCGCECEQQLQLKAGVNSSDCSHHGDLGCGTCTCNQGFGGNRCQCNLGQEGVSTVAQLLERCKRDSNSLICNGRGVCECGKCKCDKSHIYGNFCQCDSLSCPESFGKICSGRGTCDCGECDCELGYTGKDCSCTLDEQSCKEGGIVCSGHGTCECGVCKCEAGYSGSTCGIVNEHDQDFQGGANDNREETGDKTDEFQGHGGNAEKDAEASEEQEHGYEQRPEEPDKLHEHHETPEPPPQEDHESAEPHEPQESHEPHQAEENHQANEENNPVLLPVVTEEPSKNQQQAEEVANQEGVASQSIQEDAPEGASQIGLAPLARVFMILNFVFVIFVRTDWLL